MVPGAVPLVTVKLWPLLPSLTVYVVTSSVLPPVPITLALANACVAPVTVAPYRFPTTAGAPVDVVVPLYVFVSLTALIASGAGATDTDVLAVVKGW